MVPFLWSDHINYLCASDSIAPSGTEPSGYSDLELLAFVFCWLNF